LSAHADGGELAAYAAALKPRRVALVHGDDEARAALRTLLTETEVLLPTNGGAINWGDTINRPPTGKQGRATSVGADLSRPSPQRSAAERVSILRPLPALPTAIGKGVPFDYPHIEELWRAVTEVPT